MTTKVLHHLRSTKGFTLIEALVAGSIFVIIMGMVGGVLFNAFSTDRKATISKNLYEETRIALERVAKEVRKGTIDYEEYWSWYRQPSGPTSDTDYGKNYGQYGLQFYRQADFPLQTPSSPGTRSRSDDNVGLSAGSTAIGDATDTAYGRCDPTLVPAVPTVTNIEQCELYLISAEGREKTVFRLAKDSSVTPAEYRLTMLKLNGYDCGAAHDCVTRDTSDPTDGDGQIDTFVAEGDFAGYVFRPIQPDTINIKRLSFFVSPLDDPRKAFANFDNAVQVQPHVTIVITAAPSKKQQGGLRGEIPEITLQTTITARAQNEVKSLK